MTFLLNGGHVLFPDRPKRPDPFQLAPVYGVHHFFADIAPSPTKMRTAIEEQGIILATAEVIGTFGVLVAEENIITATVEEIDVIEATIEEIDNDPLDVTVEEC